MILLIVSGHLKQTERSKRSLPDYVINANSIGILENSLDRFWSNQACLFDYKAGLTGTESRSQL